jgi:hypothetical protein
MADAAWSPDDSRFRWRSMKGITLEASYSFHGLGEYIAVPVASNGLDRNHADRNIHLEAGVGL